jgi:hypothetical protein
MPAENLFVNNSSPVIKLVWFGFDEHVHLVGCLWERLEKLINVPYMYTVLYLTIVLYVLYFAGLLLSCFFISISS